MTILKRVMTLIVSFLFIMSTSVVILAKEDTNKNVFTELNYYWAKTKLVELKDNNSTTLDDDRVIYPNSRINRGEFVLLLDEAIKVLDGNTDRVFYNLPITWWTDANGFIDDSGLIDPLNEISSEEAVAILTGVFGITSDYPNGFFERDKQATILQTMELIQFTAKELYKNDELYILDISPLGVNLIGNSSFDLPMSNNLPDTNGSINTEDSWTFFESNGGAGFYTLEEGIKIDITSDLGIPAYGVQLLQEPLDLVKGDVYKIIFDAKSS